MHLQMFPFLLFFQLFGIKVFQVFTSGLDPIVTGCHNSLFISNFASLILTFSLLLVLLGFVNFVDLCRANPGLGLVRLVSVSLLSALALVICGHPLSLGLAAPSLVGLLAVALLF